MSDGDRPAGMGAGKIVLIVVAVAVGLGILCCGVGAFMARDKISQTVSFTTASAAFQTRLASDFGAGTMMNFVPDDDGMVLLVGVRPAPTEENLAELQDKAWRVYCEVYKDGGLPITSLAIGEGAAPANAGKNPVRRWRKNVVTVEELAERTGVPAPPVSKLFEGMDQNSVQVQVGGTGEDSEDPEAGGDAPK